MGAITMKMLNTKRFFLPALLACVVSTALGAAEVGAAAQAAAAQPATMTKVREASDAITPAQLARAQAKFAHATQIADQFASSAAAEGLPARWRTEMINTLMKNPESAFEQVQSKGNISDAMLAANSLGGGKVAPATQPDFLGDVTDDLTYIPLASPCRIVDTRKAGGIVVGTIARNFVVSPSNTTQGGSGCNPWTGYIGGGLAGAVAVNITVDANGQSAIPGSYLTAFATGAAVPATSWLNFAGGQVVSNAGILPLSTSPSFGFTVLTSATTHVIVDVTGSFVRPAATALDCLRVHTSTSAASGHSFYISPGTTCPSTHTLTGTSCYSGTSGVYTSAYVQYSSTPETGYTSGGQGSCAIDNTTASAATVNVDQFCCRTPGR
ncbi:MAG: hypothetical protein JSS16_14390 [Proteobacteria bacterium]|nr:hypothetical protein [Pseudomonadota bacterium]